jgi:nucleoside-diphosphate-sugar epimerase
MRILVLGGSGVLGRELIPALCAAGHDVAATCRSLEARHLIEALGADPVEADGLDSERIASVVASSEAEALINQLTSLPDDISNPISTMRAATINNKLRGEIGPAVTEAAARAGITRIISQSVAFACAPSAEVLRGDEPLWIKAGGPFGKANQALATLEAATTLVNGTVLRYGALYGPGTYYASDGAFTKMIAERRLPIIGEGRGRYGFVHVADAATATIAALDAEPGTYSVVDDTPVRAEQWMTAAALALGAKSPRRLPRWTAAGPLSVLRYITDDQPAVSNERTREALGWSPLRPNWSPDLISSMTGS